MGYERNDIVEGEASFAVRGGIVDVFAVGDKNPYRIEFFDDEIDSIRSFDVITQKSIKNTDHFRLTPAKEYLLSDEERGYALKILEKNLKNTKKSSEAYAEQSLIIQKIKDKSIDEDKYLYNLCGRKLKNISDLFECSIFIEDLFSLQKEYETLVKESKDDLKELLENGRIFKNQTDLFFSFNEITQRLEEKITFIFWDLEAKALQLRLNKLIDIHCVDFVVSSKSILLFLQEITLKKKSGYTCLIVYKNEKEKNQVISVLEQENLRFGVGIVHEKEIYLYKDSFPFSFDFMDEKLFVVSASNIFLLNTSKPRKKKISKEKLKEN